jgi:hypothetical protein
MIYFSHMTDKKQTISTGTGIIIAGFVIAIAILVSLGGNSPAVQNQAAAGSVLNEITEKDHVYGDPEAPITMCTLSSNHGRDRGKKSRCKVGIPTLAIGKSSRGGALSDSV